MPFVFTSFFLFLLSFSAVFAQQSAKPEVGNIVFNARTDKSTFSLCYLAYQNEYYVFGNRDNLYRGGKKAIRQYFSEKFVPVPEAEQESGWLTIRFMVNCKGETDRFRVSGMDTEFNPKTFAESLSQQLLTLAKAMDGWQPAFWEGQPYDYYFFLSFKIRNGKLDDILP